MSKQSDLNIKNERKLETVEGFKFEPIKGYPMLQWKGKRPFTSTQFYPAQLKENHGENVSGKNCKGEAITNWMNRIYWGDNLQVMSHLLKEFRGKVNLIYVDPPFDSKADYKKLIGIRSRSAKSDFSAFEEKQYSDIWSNDEYLQFIYERIILLKELLAEDGSIYIHLNHSRVHLVKCIMDEVFGPDMFRNDIIWKNAPAKSHPKYFGRIKDTILFYTHSTEYCWNKQYGELSEEYKSTFKKKDSRGYYVTQPLHSGKPAKEVPKWRGIKPPEGRGWAYKIETLDQFDQDGLVEFSGEGVPRLKRYLDDIEGAVIQDVWDDIPPVLAKSLNYEGYPTQKPEALLDRILSASSNPGDIVFDGFMGSGTTQAAAMRLGRRFLGADINLGAIQTTTKRLLLRAEEIKRAKIQTELKHDEPGLPQETNYIGFSVFNVNNYDVFRNPVQAKDLLIQALEIQPMPCNSLYEGEKDGRMVKIMPVNRIATKADLNDLLTGFDYKDFQKRAEKSPNKPVASLLLVCMGHEPDLAAYLRSQCQGFELDVEVVDILRDKANLEFKRDSQAEITVKKGVLKIEAFYPMNLLQKLSLMKENVKEWRELVESVMIDWNYDGAVFEPALVDVPEKEEFVKSEYPVPKDAGIIYVKITDLLSESLEMEVPRG